MSVQVCPYLAPERTDSGAHVAKRFLGLIDRLVHMHHTCINLCATNHKFRSLLMVEQLLLVYRLLLVELVKQDSRIVIEYFLSFMLPIAVAC